MRKSIVVILALLLTVGASSIASAEVFTNFLTSTTTSEVLILSCSFCPGTDGRNEFSYALANPVGNTDRIGGFTLEFPGLSVDDFIITQTPDGWVSAVIIPDSKINWDWVNFSNPDQQLDPGEAFQFAFTTTLPFGGNSTVNASAQNGNGYSGSTCGPVIPEPFSMILGAMGLLSVAGFKKVKR